MSKIPNNNGRIPQTEAGEYHRTKRRLGYIEYGLGLVFLAYLLLGKTFGLRNFAMQFGGGPATWVLIYFVTAALVYEVITLPLNVLSGYFIEKKYGMLNQTPKSWALDLVKAQILSLVLGIIAVESIYLVIRLAGEWWWVAAGVVFALFFIVMAQLTPVLILPIFYKFKKISEGDLTRRLSGLCEKAGAQIMGVYEWDMSSKTDRANAAVVGWGRTRRVVLSDSLLERFTPSEIEVVLAHELGHHKLKHVPQLLIFQMAVTFIAFWAADLLFKAVGPPLGVDHIQNVAGMPLIFLTFALVGLVSVAPINMISRRMERQADRFAFALTDLTGSFVSAMERLAVMNLGEFEPHPAVEFLFHSHPSPAKRIKAAKEYASQQRENADAFRGQP